MRRAKERRRDMSENEKHSFESKAETPAENRKSQTSDHRFRIRLKIDEREKRISNLFFISAESIVEH